jgi:DNA mismatch endonuclease (patch repair protein)
MSAIRSENTKPEIALRKALWAKGFRFRKHYGEEKIDIAFPKLKIAIFVDGCFWHSCPIHSHLPKSNEGYWHPKLQRNKERDKITNERLREAGWTILRFWEHELKCIDDVLAKINAEIDKNQK